MDVSQNSIKINQTFQVDGRKPKLGLQPETPTIPFNQIFSLFTTLDKSIETELNPGIISGNLPVNRLNGNQQSGMIQENVDLKHLENILISWAAEIQQEHLSSEISTKNTQPDGSLVNNLNNDIESIPLDLDNLKETLFEWLSTIDSGNQTPKLNVVQWMLPIIQMVNKADSSGNQIDNSVVNVEGLQEILKQSLTSGIFDKYSNSSASTSSLITKEHNVLNPNPPLETNKGNLNSWQNSNQFLPSAQMSTENNVKTIDKTLIIEDKPKEVPALGIGSGDQEQITTLPVPKIAAVVSKMLTSFVRGENGLTQETKADFLLHVESAGLIKIDFVSKQDEISGQIIADTPLGKEILEGQLEPIKRELQQKGINIEKLVLDIVQREIILEQPVNSQHNGMVSNLVADHQQGINIPNQGLINQQPKEVMSTDQNSRSYQQDIHNSLMDYSTIDILGKSNSIGNISPILDPPAQVGEGLINKSLIRVNQLFVDELSLSRINAATGPQQPLLAVSEFVPEVSAWIERKISATPFQDVEANAKYTLTPESLGNIDINIVLQDDRLSAEIITFTPQATDVLNRQLYRLQGGLQQSGVNVETINIVQRNVPIQNPSGWQQDLNLQTQSQNNLNNFAAETSQLNGNIRTTQMNQLDFNLLKPEILQLNGKTIESEINQWNSKTMAIKPTLNIMDLTKTVPSPNLWIGNIGKEFSSIPFLGTIPTIEKTLLTVSNQQVGNQVNLEASKSGNQNFQEVMAGNTSIINQVSVSEFVPEIANWINRNVTLIPEQKSVFRGTFSLIPSDFGNVEINVTTEYGQVAAQMIIDTPLIKDTLDSQLPQLKHGLQQHGLTLEKLDIVYTDLPIQNTEKVDPEVNDWNPETLQQNGANKLANDVQQDVRMMSPKEINPNGSLHKQDDIHHINGRNWERIHQSEPIQKQQISRGDFSSILMENGQSAQLMGSNQVNQSINLSGQSLNQDVNKLDSPVLVTDRASSKGISSGNTDIPTKTENGSVKNDLVHLGIPISQAAVSQHETETIQRLPMASIREVSSWIGQHIRLTSVQEGTTEAKFSLTPEHLGHIEIKISSHQGQITAQIFTETSLAMESLEGQLHQLKQALQQLGLNIQKLEVIQQPFTSTDITQTNPTFSQGGFHSSQEQRSQSLTRNGIKKQKDDEQMEIERETPAIPYRGSASKSSSNIDFTA
ncbi:flagellar hook-length control protein FliK [Bacillus sp. S3]|uniref:flagellar hook-length control protein FliK n=1 Tax=Bacillus sp. S3 TaxID=486398 RepID=UPI00118A1784|nr:flagellar hook-length control protein FliK [Bacillus sp. S3]QCJ42363.1 flagellar hook-length control protein FliK [Bacillus sp. S3]